MGTRNKCGEREKNYESCFRILCQPIMIISGPWENKAGRSLGLSANIYNISTFPDNQGLYFEPHGPKKMSHFNWDLIAYVNLAKPGIKYQAIMSQCEATATICEQMTQRFGNAELSNACEQFVQLFARATLPYLYEIEVSYRNIVLSIGNKDGETTRVRRELAHTVKQMANVLYCIYSNIDTDFLFNKIAALSQNRSQSITLNVERMRIVQELDRIEIKTRLLEQALFFEILLNQYSYHTQNLMAIINSAMNGKLHTSMFTSERLQTELREIKMNLPVGAVLPLEIETESLTEFLRISDLTIMHSEHYLVFLIGIPMTSVEEYTMYHPIPLPIQYDVNSIALIAPEVDFLALSNDNENFVSLGESPWQSCSNLFELSQLTNFQNPLKGCEVKLVAVDKPIWQRLSKANSWLYYTKAEYCTITCIDPPQAARVEISGMGRLTTLPSCEMHTESSILSPSFKTNRNVNL
ncbi:Envelope fusion protein, partial [Aphis craccivora]